MPIKLWLDLNTDLEKARTDVQSSAERLRNSTAEIARRFRRMLAARDGAIVPLVTEVLNPAAYVVERSVCVDTTAAGGNASLLTLGE